MSTVTYGDLLRQSFPVASAKPDYPVVKIVAETHVRKTIRHRGVKSRVLSVRERVIAEYPLEKEEQLPILNQWSLLAAELVEGAGLSYTPKAISVYVNGVLKWRRECSAYRDTSLRSADRKFHVKAIPASVIDGPDAEWSVLDEVAAEESGDPDGLRGFYADCDWQPCVATGPMRPMPAKPSLLGSAPFQA